MGELGQVRGGYHTLWWHLINDNTRAANRGLRENGSALRQGRFYLHYRRGTALYLSWHFFRGGTLGTWSDWLGADATVTVGGEDARLTGHLSFSRLFSVWVGTGLPRGWLRGWVYESRETGLKLFYIGDVLWVPVLRDDRMADMWDYYRQKRGAATRASGWQLTRAQMWPGWELKVRWPPLRWFLGRTTHHEEVIQRTPVRIPLDGREYTGEVRVEKRWRTRRLWPWPYRLRYSSWIEVEDPPRFAGKGENSWDCGDDAIYGKGSRSLNPATVVGEYITRVLENRARYGEPSGR